ncbi:hypothetical protein SAMN05216480_12352 [Pustulibacterium marinum]|uniref:Uncharacterized protein n=1 Tax=Pustulibacterium marinum TaxID=1224947 RepID=A0A1I7IWQ9_9FLAO|nr:hypothetical protein [Pustulibacterium marinum]SFU77387.1 hypothetical protein SAMN05216480_12352 [Pustulibacterium marinum]
MKRVLFEDLGQDILWWDVNHDGEIVDCGPFHKQLYVGGVTDPCNDLEVGTKLNFISPVNGESRVLKYRVDVITETPKP